MLSYTHTREAAASAAVAALPALGLVEGSDITGQAKTALPVPVRDSGTVPKSKVRELAETLTPRNVTEIRAALLALIIYKDGVPPEWSEMSPAEAGYNSAKEKLYHAIRPYAVKEAASKEPGNPRLTRKEVLEMQRAIALYNSYGFGYMLGMNLRNPEGRRERLWPGDLDEILAKGHTEQGCRIV